MAQPRLEDSLGRKRCRMHPGADSGGTAERTMLLRCDDPQEKVLTALLHRCRRWRQAGSEVRGDWRERAHCDAALLRQESPVRSHQRLAGRTSLHACPSHGHAFPAVGCKLNLPRHASGIKSPANPGKNEYEWSKACGQPLSFTCSNKVCEGSCGFFPLDLLCCFLLG